MPFTQESIKKLMNRANMCDVCGKHEKAICRNGIGYCGDCYKKLIDKQAEEIKQKEKEPRKLPFNGSDRYGLPDMSILEECNLPPLMRQTISNKVTMVDKCGLLRQALDQVEFRAKHIHVMDDAKHSAGVQEMTDVFLQAYDLLWKAALHGIH